MTSDPHAAIRALDPLYPLASAQKVFFAKPPGMDLEAEAELLPQMVERGHLLGFQGKEGAWAFPIWQFAPQGGVRGELFPLFGSLLLVGAMDGLEASLWLTAPREALDGRSVREVLELPLPTTPQEEKKSPRGGLLRKAKTQARLEGKRRREEREAEKGAKEGDGWGVTVTPPQPR